MIAIGVFLILLALAGVFGCGMLFGHQRALKAHVCPVPVLFPVAPANRQLELALDRIRVRDERIAFLESIEVVPVSPYTILPKRARVPSRTEVAVSERLAVEVMRLRLRVEAAEEDATYFKDLAAKRWKWLKVARAKVRELTPAVAELPLLYSDFERECSLKDAYHEKARSFAERITNAREAIASEAMRDEIDSILGGNILSFPVRERQAA